MGMKDIFKWQAKKRKTIPKETARQVFFWLLSAGVFMQHWCEEVFLSFLALSHISQCTEPAERWNVSSLIQWRIFVIQNL